MMASPIDLREDMPDEVLHLPRLLARQHPAPSALENDPVHLHVAFLASGAKHREFLRLHEKLDDLGSARALVQAGVALGAASCSLVPPV